MTLTDKQVLFILPFFITLVMACAGCATTGGHISGYDNNKPKLIIDAGGHTAKVTKVIFTPDEKYILSCSEDKTIRLWNIRTGENERTFRGYIQKNDEGKVYTISLSPDRKFLAAGGWFKGNVIRIYDFKTGEIIKLLRGHKNRVLNLEFSPGGRYLVSSGAAGDLISWDVAGNFQLRKKMSYHTRPVYGLALSGNGKYLASASDDRSFTIRKLANGKIVYRKENAHDSKIHRIEFSPGGKFFATGSHDGTVKLWDAGKFKFIRTVYRVKEYYIQEIKFSPDGRYLAFGGRYREKIGRRWIRPVFFYNLKSRSIEKKFLKHNNSVNYISFSKTGRFVASAGGDDNEIFVYSGKDLDTVKVIKSEGRTLFTLGMGRDGETIYFGNTNRGVSHAASSPVEISFQLKDFTVEKVPGVIYDQKFVRIYQKANNMTIRFLPAINKRRILFGGRDYILPRYGDTVRSYTFTPDGKFVIVGSDFGLTKVDADTGKASGEFTGHTGAVNALTVTQDSRYLLSGSWDQTIKIWKIKNCRLVATIFISRDNGYLVWTPDFYYTGSKRLFKYVGWHLNRGPGKAAKYYPFEQFDLKYNRPGIVLKRIGLTGSDVINAYNTLYKKRINKMGFDEDDLTGELHLPEIDFKAGKRKNSKISISLAARDSRFTLDRLNLFINNVPIKGFNGIPLKKHNTKEYHGTLDIDLLPGRNKIQVSVLNGKGVESLKETINIFNNNTTQKPDLFLATIGVSKYKESIFNLRYADKDARDMVKIFKTNKKRFNRVHILELNNENATKDLIGRNVKKFFKKSKVNDLAILFIAGHGLRDKTSNNYFFGTHDIDFRNPSRRGYRFDELDRLIDNIPAVRKLFLMDTCYSGEYNEDDYVTVKKNSPLRVIGTRGVPVFKRGVLVVKEEVEKKFKLFRNDFFADLRRGTGAVVITSSSGIQQSLEGGKSLEGSEIKNGLFTYSLIKGLIDYRSDKNRDHKIQVSEIMDWVYYEVIKLAKMTKQEQTPTMRRENIEFDYVIF